MKMPCLQLKLVWSSLLIEMNRSVEQLVIRVMKLSHHFLVVLYIVFVAWRGVLRREVMLWLFDRGKTQSYRRDQNYKKGWKADFLGF